MKKSIIAILAILIMSQLASAVVVSSVNAVPFYPGKEGQIAITVRNVLNDDAEDLTFSLNLANGQFITNGGSSDSVDEIRENKEETFYFKLRPAYDIKPGDYSIPYTINYRINGEPQTKTGSIGIQVTAQPELSFSISEDTPVVGMQGKITLKIVNDGLSDARFVSVRAIPQGFTITSDDEIYVGSVSSDDFETASFDAIFSEENPTFKAVVEYRDIDNNRQISKVEIPFNVYSEDEAIKLGIIKRSNAVIYIGVILVLIIVWIIWRAIAKRRRMKSRQNG